MTNDLNPSDRALLWTALGMAIERWEANAALCHGAGQNEALARVFMGQVEQGRLLMERLE